MPLRIRLVVILVILVAIGLGAVLSITYRTTRTSLVSNVDSQLSTSVNVWTQYFEYLRSEGPPPTFESVQPDTFAGLYSLQGNLVHLPQISIGGTLVASNPVAGCTTCHVPPLPRPLLRQLVASNPTQESFTTIGGSGGGYAVLAQVLSFRDGGTALLIIGFPLTGVNATMNHLLYRELFVGVSVLAALAIVSWFLVRLGLRPLEEMASTASEIAAGDLTKRVGDADPRTEVGQLGAALNAMLTQIERAFRERAASEERLRRFVGDASHELRTPLTSIRGYAELFKGGAIGRPEDLAAALGRIESESTRMGGLVDDLLLLARLDQGRPLGNDRVDLAQLAADAVQDARVVDPSRSVGLISTGPCIVVGDDQRLRQVLGNLITNAMTYSPPGSPIEVAVHLDRPPVDVSGLPGVPGLPTLNKFGRMSRSGRPATSEAPAAPVRPLSAADLVEAGAVGSGPSGNGSAVAWVPTEVIAGDNGGPADGLSIPPPLPPPDVLGQGARVSVAVIDHGPGIEAENVPHVFERFWRADESRQRASGGTGLGLSIVAAVVAAHDGRVDIRQTPGGGATVVVDLPAAPPSPATAVGAAVPAEAGE